MIQEFCKVASAGGARYMDMTDSGPLAGKSKITYISQMKDFKKYFVVSATPEEVYLAMTTASTLNLWTGEVAVMTDTPGSEFSLWDGSIVGKNVAFEKGKMVVQQWYFDTQEEPSIVTLKLHPASAGTSVELKHTNIPDEEYESIVDGWVTVYFASLQEFYEN